MERITTTAPQIHYPESDGKPMGETDVHIDALIYLREALRDHFRDDPQRKGTPRPVWHPTFL